ncbi:MAG: hypothetical protein KDC34_08370 [Saprospiraceae bacterium]|nr:hypothetical protein [Saprospiraceae bacterium]
MNSKRTLLAAGQMMFLAVLFCLVSANPLQALNVGEVGVRMVSAPILLSDADNPPANGTSEVAQIGFEVRNTSGTILNDLYADLSNINGSVSGFTLAAGQEASQFIGTLKAGESKIVYWEFSFPYQQTEEKASFDVTVGDKNPGVVVVSENIIARNPDYMQKPSTYSDLLFRAPEQMLLAGQGADVWFTGSGQDVIGYQFTLNVNPEKAKIENILYGVAESNNIMDKFAQSGRVTVSWHQLSARVLEEGEQQFGIRLIATKDILLSDLIQISSDYTAAEGYSPTGDLMDVKLLIGDDIEIEAELIFAQGTSPDQN